MADVSRFEFGDLSGFDGVKVKEFDYYRHGERLIQVKDDVYFKDITPHANYKISYEDLKASFKKWQNAETNLNQWVHVGTFEFCTDHDDFMKFYNSFKSKITKLSKPKQQHKEIDSDLSRRIRKLYEADTPIYSIAKRLSISRPTVYKYLKLEGVISQKEKQGVKVKNEASQPA